MKTTTKASLYVTLIFFVTYFIIRFSIQSIFTDINIYLLTIITVLITVLLSPQRRIVKKKAGDQIQLKWIFSKKVIVLK